MTGFINPFPLFFFLFFSFSFAQPQFSQMCHTKAQYDEEGPRIVRHSPVFSASM